MTARTGVAYASPVQAAVPTGGWTYDIPLTTLIWYSASGAESGGGRPSCLAPGETAGIQFGSVTVTNRGSTWRQVVWVKC